MSPFEPNPIRSVLVLGNSQKFLDGIKRHFPRVALTILPWRRLSAFATDYKLDDEYFDLVFVCGYDYESYGARYDDYLNTNVYAVIKVLSKCGKCRKLVYVDTEETSKRYTLSRYVYAKKLLGKLLNSTGCVPELHIMRPCSIITDKVDIHGTWVEAAIFAVLEKFGRVRTVHIDTLFQRLVQNQYLVSSDVSCPIPVGLTIKRTRMIDRGLRFLYG